MPRVTVPVRFDVSRGIKMEAEPAVPEKAPEPVAEMSFYDSYMASRFVCRWFYTHFGGLGGLG